MTLEELENYVKEQESIGRSTARKYGATYYRWIDGTLVLIKRALIGWEALDSHGRCIMRDILLCSLQERLDNEYSSF